MGTPFDYKKYAVLLVDEGEKSLRCFKVLCGDQFSIVSAGSARQGLEILQQPQPELGVLIANRCMREETGIWLLERARELRPDVVRLLLSDGCRWDEVMGALRSGVARRIIRIPWEPGELEMTMRSELEVFMLQRERSQLLEDLRRMLADRVTSLRLVSGGLNNQLRELLQAPRVFVERVPLNLQAQGVNVRDLRDTSFWQDLYEHVKAQFARIDEVLKTLRMAADEQELTVDDRTNLREVIRSELALLKEDLEARHLTVEDELPEDLPDTAVVADKLQRLFGLLLRYKMARIAHPAKVQIAARLLETEHHTRDQIEVTVADNAPGPSPATAPDPDSRLNRTLSSIIIYEQGGSLDARKEENKGTTFMIRLPVAQKPVPSPT